VSQLWPHPAALNESADGSLAEQPDGFGAQKFYLRFIFEA
jgi:hypothetical protein